MRSILFACEAVPAGSTPEIDALGSLCADRAALVEHVALLSEAGLLSVIDASSHDGGHYIIQRLTWTGHEFLDSVRDDGLWKKAKEHVLKPGASWTFDILKEWAKHEVKQRLGLPS